MSVCQNMKWETGAKVFQKFLMHLLTEHRDIWEQSIKEVLDSDSSKTTEDFVEVLNQFRLTLLDGYEYEEQMEYL